MAWNEAEQIVLDVEYEVDLIGESCAETIVGATVCLFLSRCFPRGAMSGVPRYTLAFSALLPDMSPAF